MNKADIINLLHNNDRAIGRALVALNARQTTDEQSAQQVINRNGMGFRPCHARMGTSMAEFFLKRGFLSPKQISYWKAKQSNGQTRIEIYAGQLLIVAIEKLAMKDAMAERIADKSALNAAEQAEEIARCIYKMNRG